MLLGGPTGNRRRGTAPLFSGPRLWTPDSHTQHPHPRSSLGAVWPSLRDQKPNLSIPHLPLSQTQESGFPHMASAPDLISQDSQLSVHVGPFLPGFFF